MKNLLNSGTFKDKVSALSLLVRENSDKCLTNLQRLVKIVRFVVKIKSVKRRTKRTQFTRFNVYEICLFRSS